MTNSDATTPPVAAGTLSFREDSVWYRIAGSGEEPGRLPLLVLHGGPGTPSDYLWGLDSLAHGRRVIYYDQHGAGRTDGPADPALYSLDLYLEELSVVRRTLHLDRAHILGHAWGGMLALEHALRGAPGVASLILVSATASVPDWQREVDALISLMPEPHRSALHAARASGIWQGAAVADAIQVFAARHLYRGGFPPSMPHSPPSPAYLALFGSSALDAGGRLKQWDVSARLGDLAMPALVMGGGHDQMTPLVTGALHRGIPYSEYALFESSAHFPHLEEAERFLAVVEDFLTRVEAYL